MLHLKWRWLKFRQRRRYGDWPPTIIINEGDQLPESFPVYGRVLVRKAVDD